MRGQGDAQRLMGEPGAASSQHMDLLGSQEGCQSGPFLPSEHLAMSADIFVCHNWRERVLLASDGQKLLNILQCPEQPPSATPLHQRIIVPQTSIVLRLRNLGLGDTVGRSPQVLGEPSGGGGGVQEEIRRRPACLHGSC